MLVLVCVCCPSFVLGISLRRRALRRSKLLPSPATGLILSVSVVLSRWCQQAVLESGSILLRDTAGGKPGTDPAADFQRIYCGRKRKRVRACGARCRFNLLPICPKIRMIDRKSTRLNSSHVASSYAVFCLKKKTSTSGRGG